MTQITGRERPRNAQHVSRSYSLKFAKKDTLGVLHGSGVLGANAVFSHFTRSCFQCVFIGKTKSFATALAAALQPLVLPGLARRK